MGYGLQLSLLQRIPSQNEYATECGTDMDLAPGQVQHTLPQPEMFPGSRLTDK